MHSWRCPPRERVNGASSDNRTYFHNVYLDPFPIDSFGHFWRRMYRLRSVHACHKQTDDKHHDANTHPLHLMQLINGRQK
jgi:hypothetical protein